MIVDELIDVWLLDISIEPHYSHQQFVIISRSWLVSDGLDITQATGTALTSRTHIYIFLRIPSRANKQD